MAKEECEYARTAIYCLRRRSKSSLKDAQRTRERERGRERGGEGREREGDTPTIAWLNYVCVCQVKGDSDLFDPQAVRQVISTSNSDVGDGYDTLTLFPDCRHFVPIYFAIKSYSLY